MTKKVAIVAGEASGDLIASHLLIQLKKKHPDIQFIGVGGPLMLSAGLRSLFPFDRLSLHGFGWDVIKQVPSLLRARRKLAKQIIHEQPNVFIGVDAPDFNLGLERMIKKAGIPTVHYVSPSIWAWRKGRISKIKKCVSRMLTLFPFESALYQNKNIDVDYVGHPLADQYSLMPHTNIAREKLGLDETSSVIAILPGSRNSEVNMLADIMLQTAAIIAEESPETIFLVPLINRQTKALFEQKMYGFFDTHRHLPTMRVMFGHSKLAMEASNVVLVASGTATLEAALLKKPMVITYKVSWLSWQILSRLRYLSFVGLPNILANESVVPELLQSEAKPDLIANALIDLLHNNKRRKYIVEKFTDIHKMLRQNTEAKIAAIIDQYLK